MNHWVNIHHPRAVNEARSSQCQVYLQEKSKQWPSVGDRVFIYETEALSGETVISEDEDGSKQRVKLGQGTKGIIALVQIVGSLKKRKWIWNGTPYIGSYRTKEIETKKRVIKLIEINKGYSDMGISNSFNPRTYTGLRKLKRDEIKALSKLLGVR